jgi:YaiO family outer membrane protein
MQHLIPSRLMASGLMAAALVLMTTPAHAQDADQARQMLRQGLAAQAEAAYGALIAQSPNDPDHWLGRGLARARQSLWGAAAQDLEKAVAISPGYADAWSALADVYRWSDRPAAAADAYGRLAVLRPQDAQVQIQRARSWVAAGELAAARRAAQRARELGAAESDLPALPPETASPSLPAWAVADLLPPRQQPEVDGEGFGWALTAGVAGTDWGAGTAREGRLTLRHFGPRGSIAVTQVGLRSRGDHDRGWTLDAYPRLWTDAYANVRYQRAGTPTLYPGKAWRVELFQHLGSDWELAASHDRLDFSAPVEIEGVALGYYWGDFYARWRHQRVRTDVSTDRGNRFVLRYYYGGDADHYLEFNASQGSSDDFDSALVQGARVGARGLAWTHFVRPDWGVQLSARQARDRSSPGSRVRDVALGLTTRW